MNNTKPCVVPGSRFNVPPLTCAPQIPRGHHLPDVRRVHPGRLGVGPAGRGHQGRVDDLRTLSGAGDVGRCTAERRRRRHGGQAERPVVVVRRQEEQRVARALGPRHSHGCGSLRRTRALRSTLESLLYCMGQCPQDGQASISPSTAHTAHRSLQKRGSQDALTPLHLITTIISHHPFSHALLEVQAAEAPAQRADEAGTHERDTANQQECGTVRLGPRRGASECLAACRGQRHCAAGDAPPSILTSSR